MKKPIAVLILTLCAALIAAAKERVWISGTVVAIEQIHGRVMQAAPAHNYVIRTESAEYTLEHAARTYYTDPPTALVHLGDSVEVAPDGKNAILKAGTVQKKLRVIKTSTPVK